MIQENSLVNTSSPLNASQHTFISLNQEAVHLKQDIDNAFPSAVTIAKSKENDTKVTLFPSSIELKLSEEHKLDLITDMLSQEENYLCQNCLKKHKITPSLRAEMVNWMIEALSTFQCSDQTFFKAVTILDLYFLNTYK